MGCLIMLRARGISGPMFQKCGSKLIKGVGNFYRPDTGGGGTQVLFVGDAINQNMASASSEWDASFPPEEAFNGIVSATASTDIWMSADANPPNPDGSCWIQWDFGAAKEITALRMFPRGTNHLNRSFPNHIEVYAGEDPTFAIGTLVGTANLVYFDGDWSPWAILSNPISARYLRIEIHTKTQVGAGTWVAVQETEFLELV